MRTLLINTPYPSTEYPTMPLGLAYIAAVLEKEGLEVQVLDFLVSKYTREKLAEKIAEFSPEVVGITSVTMNYPIASGVLRDCKQIDGNIITVIGGPHVSFWAEEALNEAPWIDIVVRGEGEYTMLDIIHDKPLTEIDGIAFRRGGNTILNKPRQWIANLDELPFPARHLFPIPRYRTIAGECGLVTSRGCPFNCNFCVGHKMVGKNARFRDIKLVVDEVEEILGYGFTTINVSDDLLTLNRQHIEAFCDEVMARKLRFRWTAFSRVDTVTPELLHRMNEAGCFFICYGVESGNQKILDTIRKKITPEKVKQAVTISKKAGIASLASFIMGLPGETKETAAETITFARDLGARYGFHLLSPFPGTEVRERAEEYGLRILTDDWSRYNANEAIVETEGISAEELSEVDRNCKEDVVVYIDYLEELAREGRLSDDEREDIDHINRTRFQEIVTRLLQEDIIENMGTIETKGDIITELADRVSKEIVYPYHHLKQVIKDMVNQQILKYELAQGKVRWKWNH